MPRESKSDLRKRLETLVTDARSSVDPRHTDWTKYWDFYNGDHKKHLGHTLKRWEEDDWTNINRCFSLIETQLPILLDAAPAWYVMTPSSEFEGGAKELENALQAIWHHRRVSRELHMALKDELVLGIGLLKGYWDARLGEELPTETEGEKIQVNLTGDVNVSWLDPYSFYPDPGARRLEECEYIALANDMSAAAMRRLYPDFNSGEADELQAPQEGNRPGFFQRFGKWWLQTFGGLAGSKENKLYRLWEVYHEAGDRLSVYSGKQVLFDGANPTPRGPYANHRYPVFSFVDHETGHSMWGMSEFEQLMMLQRAINITNMRMIWHKRFMGNPRIITDHKVVTTGEPGEQIEVKPNARFEAIAPPALPADALAHFHDLQDSFDDISGIHDVTRGERPPSLQSGIALQHLQEAGQTRLRLLTRMGALTLEDVGQCVANLMSVNYREPRWLSYVGPTGPVNAHLEPEHLRQVVGEDRAGNPLELMVPYRVSVQASGDLPLNAIARAELTMQVIPIIARMDDVHANFLLEAVNLPGRRELMNARLAARQQAQQMQAQAAQQQAAQEDFLGQLQAMGGQGQPGGAEEIPGMEAMG